MSMQVSWNSQAAPVGYARQKTAAGEPASTRSAAAGQDQVTISPEARAAYASSANGQTELEVNPSQGKTTFPSPFSALFENSQKITKILNDYYRGQVAEAMKFANPKKHIDDKYKNENSPYFRWDMTAAERDVAWQLETQIYYSGRLTIDNFPNNYALRAAGIDASELTIDNIMGQANQKTRTGIASSIQELLGDRGIELPKGTSFRLTVNPYDYRIQVSGLEDSALAQLIEETLNHGENGYNLYYHLWFSDPVKATSNAATYKTGLFHITKQLTGYDMRELQTGNGHFYLPDGRELWSVLVEAAGKAGPQQVGDLDLSIYHHTYTYLGMRGWDGAPDATLNIDYIDGQLRDVPEEPEQPGDTGVQSPEETGSGYGLRMLADGKFHEAEIPLTVEQLRKFSEEIRGGKAALEPVEEQDKP